MKGFKRALGVPAAAEARIDAGPTKIYATQEVSSYRVMIEALYFIQPPAG